MASSPPAYLPHYSVCRVMARIDHVRATAECPEDVVYQCRTLVSLSARAVALLPQRPALPEELAEAVDAEAGAEWRPWIAKAPSCDSLTHARLKHGEFGLFPTATTAVCPQMWSVDLIRLAPATLRFLRMCVSRPELWDPAALTRAAMERYPLWLELLRAKKPGQLLVPPADVALVWFSHMLQSADYHELAGAPLHWEPHVCTWVYEVTDLAVLMRNSEAAWTKHTRALQPWVPWTLDDGPVTKPHAAQRHPAGGPACGRQARDARVQCGSERWYDSEIPVSQVKLANPVVRVDSLSRLVQLPDVVLDDGDWFTNFAASQQFRTIGFTPDELASFVLGYQRYLYLVAKMPQRMEWIGFAPTPAIDLIWHTHLLCPRSYWRDVGFLFGGAMPPMHKLLPLDARKPFVYAAHASAEAHLWQEEFGESLEALVAVSRK